MSSGSRSSRPRGRRQVRAYLGSSPRVWSARTGAASGSRSPALPMSGSMMRSGGLERARVWCLCALAVVPSAGRRARPRFGATPPGRRMTCRRWSSGALRVGRGCASLPASGLGWDGTCLQNHVADLERSRTERGDGTFGTYWPPEYRVYVVELDRDASSPERRARRRLDPPAGFTLRVTLRPADLSEWVGTAAP